MRHYLPIQFKKIWFISEIGSVIKSAAVNLWVLDLSEDIHDTKCYYSLNPLKVTVEMKFVLIIIYNGNAFQPLIFEAKGNASTEEKFQLIFPSLTFGILFQVVCFLSSTHISQIFMDSNKLIQLLPKTFRQTDRQCIFIKWKKKKKNPHPKTVVHSCQCPLGDILIFFFKFHIYKE